MIMLDLEHYGQPSEGYCVPACLKMVLEYARKQHGIKCPLLSIKKIAKATETLKEGTAPRAAENINALLRKAKPPIKFQTKYLAKISEIIDDLNKYHPSIVLINAVDPPNVILHAVVVIGFDPDNNLIYYNDPDESPENAVKNLELGVFDKKWGLQARLIKVLIGSKQQTYIDDWQPETGDMGSEE